MGNLILKAAGKPTTALGFWKLLIGTIVMLAFGYAGEEHLMNPWQGFAVGMAGWAFILLEIFCGEAGGLAKDCSAEVATSFNNMRLIVTVGWAIYPAGYLFGYSSARLMMSTSTSSTTSRIFSTRLALCFRAGPAPRPM